RYSFAALHNDRFWSAETPASSENRASPRAAWAAVSVRGCLIRASPCARTCVWLGGPFTPPEGSCSYGRALQARKADRQRRLAEIPSGGARRAAARLYLLQAWFTADRAARVLRAPHSRL